MLFTYNYKIDNISKTRDKEKTIMLTRRMLPEYVFDISQLEHNPLTFPQVKTLLDGITIGGHKISDVEQVLNIKNAWINLLDLIKKNSFEPSIEIFNQTNKIIAQNEAIYAGKLRNGSVSIAGTQKYKSPKYDELETIFKNESRVILEGFSPVEQAIRLFLWGCLNQFYWDGNKRTSCIVANGILINEGIGILNIRARDILEFNTLMIDFYDTQNANNIVQFLAEKCITYLED